MLFRLLPASRFFVATAAAIRALQSGNSNILTLSKNQAIFKIIIHKIGVAAVLLGGKVRFRPLRVKAGFMQEIKRLSVGLSDRNKE